jgi:hypothetical protein
MKIKYCVDCNKKLNSHACYCNTKRCQRCYTKFKKGKNNPNYRHGIHCTASTCKKCGKIIDYRAKSKLCRACWIKIIKQENSPHWKGGKPNCLGCGKKTSNYGILRCQACWAKNNQGKNNPNWTGGDREYSKDWWKIRKIIRALYKNICQVCTKKGRTVHHIDYNKKNCHQNNLINLCNRCHLKTNYNRDFWFAFFTYIKKLEENDYE